MSSATPTINQQEGALTWRLNQLQHSLQPALHVVSVLMMMVAVRCAVTLIR